MKVFMFACVLALAALAAADNLVVLDKFDYEKFFEDEEAWKASVPCILETAPCGDKQALKDATAQRLRDKCEHCTPAQREKYDRELNALRVKYPEDYEAILKKYHN